MLLGNHSRSFRIRQENRVERPLAEKSRWHHIRLAITPRYLGNHASQIKSYYGTLYGSHGRSFRMRHKKSSEAPPGGGLTMTSYPVGNKTSLLDALLLPVSSLTVPHSDYKSLIRLQALRQWELRWNYETDNKLHSFEPKINVINMFRLPRRD